MLDPLECDCSVWAIRGGGDIVEVALVLCKPQAGQQPSVKRAPRACADALDWLLHLAYQHRAPDRWLSGLARGTAAPGNGAAAQIGSVGNPQCIADLALAPAILVR
jgi:hypothetical protein